MILDVLMVLMFIVTILLTIYVMIDCGFFTTALCVMLLIYEASFIIFIISKLAKYFI